MKLHVQNLSTEVVSARDSQNSSHWMGAQLLPTKSVGKFSGYFLAMMIILLTFFSEQNYAQGTWTPVATLAPHPNGGVMLLLSDGSVMCKTASGHDTYGNLWDRLTPDIHGSYVNGKWTTIQGMHNTRLYFSSQVLMDGRVYVAGGEYGTGGAAGETYNPLNNLWTNAPSPGKTISDANSEILPDGRVLQALVTGTLTGTDLYDPVANTYTTGPNAHGIHNESAWVKLPDNSVLFVDRLTTSSERYIPASNTWITDATVPVQLYDQFGDETGAGLLLPDGRAFFLGSSGHTAYYTPSGTTANGSWAAGPNIPMAKGTPDAPAAMMVNGKILCSVSPVPTSANHFPTPTSFYEFDYLTNTFTAINTPQGDPAVNISCYVTNFLDLPDGSVLYSQQQQTNSDQYYVYTPDGSPLAAGKPTISSVVQNGCGTSFTLSGTLFNGISEGAAYGDDWQMATNYPIVRMTSGTNVYYARTSNWNSTGVQQGSLPTTTQFALPAGLPADTYSLVVIANGISSDPISFTPILTATITPLGSLDICGTGSVVLQANSGAGYTYQWLKKNVAISGETNQTYTATKKGNYKVVVTNSSGCSKTSTVIKVTSSCKEELAVTNLPVTELKIYPNPSEGQTTIQFTVPQSSHVFIKVYDLSGREINTMLNADVDQGDHTLQLNTNEFSKGIYLVRMITDSAIENVKLIVQ